MNFETLIDAVSLRKSLDDPDWVVVDCRFDLMNPDAGRQGYEGGHIRGAVYVHLNDDLSGPPVSDCGRHPVPQPEKLKALFGSLGIGNSTQVVAYDDKGGMVASRFWWLLRYLGHDRVAVLDGGLAAWEAMGGPTESGSTENMPKTFLGSPRADRLVLIDEVPEQPLLVDSRGPERYRGEVEPIDPVAGHIPGAVNFPFTRNLGPDQRFLPPALLAEQLAGCLGKIDPCEATFYCGSGVTACVNLLAMTHAGLPMGKLYGGSWSEWCRLKILNQKG